MGAAARAMAVKIANMSNLLKLVGPVGAEENFELHDDALGRFVQKLAVIIVVLQANLGKFARVVREIGRNACAMVAEKVRRVVASRRIVAKPCHPAAGESPKNLGVL